MSKYSNLESIYVDYSDQQDEELIQNDNYIYIYEDDKNHKIIQTDTVHNNDNNNEDEDNEDNEDNGVYYSISGWIPLANNYIVYKGVYNNSELSEDLNQIVTNKKEIKILMDSRFAEYPEVANSSIVCDTEDVFRVGDILNIVFNFITSNIPKENRQNISLSGFIFNKNTLNVKSEY